MTKPLKIEFAPGCFDDFEGSQEELDELIAEITRLAESGELNPDNPNVNPVDFEEVDLEDLPSFNRGRLQ